MTKSSRYQDCTLAVQIKTGLNCLEHPAHSSRVQMSRKSTQNTTIHIFNLKSTSLDVNELFYDEVLSDLLPVRLDI